MSTYTELMMDQGATFNTILDLTDDTTGQALNLSSYTARSSLRRSYYSQNVSANLVCTISDSANGQLTLSLPAANTSNLMAGKYLFDVEIVTGSTVSRVLEGVIIVTPEITR